MRGYRSMWSRVSKVVALALVVSLASPPAWAYTAPVSTAAQVSLLTADDIETILPSDARSSGSNRVDTAVAISRETDQPYGAVVIATSVNFPDALSGTPLADAANAPILLTRPEALDASVKSRLLELKAQGAQTAYLIGSASALSPAVEAAVGSVFGTAKTKRIGGANRYETAALVATELAKLRPVTGVVLASGETYPDALSAAGWAAFSGQAILLTRHDSLPAATAASLARFGHTPASGDETGTAENELLVVGSVAAISDTVIAAYPGVTRIGGANRYETSALIAQHAWEWGMPSESVGIATGLNFPDALAAGPWCAANGSPLLLVSTNTLPPAAGGYLAGHASTIKHLQVFGGTASVAKPVVVAAAEAAKVMMSKRAPIATPETDALLSDVTSDTLVFSDENAQLGELDVGWVIRSNPTSAAPEGYFRKITGIDRSNPDGSVSFETTTAAITDVLLKGSVDMVMPCGEAPEATTTPVAEDGAVRPAAVGGEAAFNQKVKFEFGPSFTFDGPSGSTIKLSSKGALAFKQSVVVSIIVDGRWKAGVLGIPYWTPYVAQFEQYVVYSGTFTLSVAVSGKVDNIKLPIGPQIPIAVDPVITGFVVKPEVQLYLKGSISLEISASVELTIAETKTGIRYRDGRGWESFDKKPGESSKPSIDTMPGESGSFKLGIGAEVAVSICDFAGPYLDLTLLFGKVKLTVDPADPSVVLKVDVGSSIAGGLKVDFPILGTNLARVELFDAEIVYFGWSWKFGWVQPSVPDSGAATRVSTGFSGAQGNGHAYAPSISADGRYVAFESKATNLIFSDTNDVSDIYVNDRLTGTTFRVSTDSSGYQGYDGSYHPSISADGRYVAFESDSPNLVPDDTNGNRDAFVKDRVTGTTTRVSAGSSGVPCNGGYTPSISASGRYVAFWSYSGSGGPDVFVNDTLTGTTTLVSADSSGIPGNSYSGTPSISADGRYVAFTSEASNLVPANTGGVRHIFVKDTATGTTILASADSSCTPGGGDSGYVSSISADGRYVTFESRASSLVPDDTNDAWDIFVRDTATGATTLVSADSSGTPCGGDSGAPSISADGRYVTFGSSASNLVPDDTNGVWDIFVKDTETGTTTRVSTDSSGAQGGNDSSAPSISANGRFVAFCSYAANLVSGDTNGVSDIFVKDRGTSQ